MNHGEGQRQLADLFDEPVDVPGKPMAQSESPHLVPSDRVAQIIDRERFEEDGLQGLVRNSARSSLQGRAGRLSWAIATSRWSSASRSALVSELRSISTASSAHSESRSDALSPAGSFRNSSTNWSFVTAGEGSPIGQRRPTATDSDQTFPADAASSRHHCCPLSGNK